MRATVPLVVVLLLGATLGGAMVLAMTDEGPAPGPDPTPPPDPADDSFEMVTADSESDFMSYIEAGNRQGGGFGRVALTGAQVSADADRSTAVESASGEPAPAARGGDGGAGVRYGETNVQVEGIDEPDVLKTVDGRFYYSLPATGWSKAGPSRPGPRPALSWSTPRRRARQA